MQELEPKQGIKSWAEEDRPREKLLLNGIEHLTDAELIAILIGSGNRNETAVDLSKRILSSFQNNLNLLGKAGLHDLQQFKGIGEAKAISIAAAMELGRRRKLSEIIEKKSIGSSADAAQILQSKLADLPHEEFWVLLLNRKNGVIDQRKISQGGISATVIDVRILFKLAIEKLAAGIIVGHNHPSGNLQPSKEDISITKKIKEVSAFFDIRFLDHVIVSDGGYYSFADEGML